MPCSSILKLPADCGIITGMHKRKQMQGGVFQGRRRMQIQQAGQRIKLFLIESKKESGR